ncbi:leucine-rich repeat protein [bacterium]|nr:leucine-rich repeat protein [bacterium]
MKRTQAAFAAALCGALLLSGCSQFFTSFASMGIYSVQFEENGGSAVQDRRASLIATMPVPALEGQAFAGWYGDAALSEASKVSFPYDPLADVTLYAKWVPATEGLSYAESGSGYSVSNSTAQGPVTIPAWWRGKPVVAIESWACSDFSGTSITIPPSVARIGSNAFLRCANLTALTLPAPLVSIGQNAFRGSGLASVAIPSAVTYIGNAAFYNCASLTTVNVQATTPPETFANVFLDNGNAIPAGLAIKVPTGTKAAYDAAYGWGHYAAKISE